MLMIHFGGITRLYIKQEMIRLDVVIGVQTLTPLFIWVTFQWLLSFHLSKTLEKNNYQ